RRCLQSRPVDPLDAWRGHAARPARPTCGRDGRHLDAPRRHTAVPHDPAVAARDRSHARPRDVKDHARYQLVSAGDLYHGVLTFASTRNNEYDWFRKTYGPSKHS